MIKKTYNIHHIMSGTILHQIFWEILARLSEGATPSGVDLGVAEDGGFKIDFR
jgi:hypothetical protein